MRSNFIFMPSMFSLKMSSSEWAWVVVCLLYLGLNLPMPLPLAEKIDTQAGIVLTGVAGMSMFMHPNPIVGILGILVAFAIVRRSRTATGSSGRSAYELTEERRWQEAAKVSSFPRTLEQEVVKKYAPIKRSRDYSQSKVRPTLGDTQGATVLSDLA